MRDSKKGVLVLGLTVAACVLRSTPASRKRILG